jgi:predicted house-cleaning noncanonical NTP pyrophosphatase (MazG superfamily)
MDFISTNHPIENEFPKLVRDNIPDIILTNSGKPAQTRIVSDDNEYLSFLLKKMVEEASEVQFSVEHGNLQEELADVLEIIDAILNLKSISFESIRETQKEKKDKNGGFGKRIILLAK